MRETAEQNYCAASQPSFRFRAEQEILSHIISLLVEMGELTEEEGRKVKQQLADGGSRRR